MNPEHRICENCKHTFVIESEDCVFYEKIQAPPPTWCPECRLMRRMCFRNEFTFYRRACDLCKKSIISVYPADAPFPVYCHVCWWGDGWNPENFALEVNFKEPLLCQFKTLLSRVPRITTMQVNCVESEYTNYAFMSKQCYLVTGAVESELCAYGNIVWKSKDSLDCFYLVKSELCYECVNCHQCYRSMFLEDCTTCDNSLYLYNCRNCSNCIGCMNLIGKQYHIFNEPHTKESYQTFLQEYEPLTVRSMHHLRTSFEVFKKRTMHRYAHLFNTQNVTGHNVRNARNVKKVFYSHELEEGGFLYITSEGKDVHDITNSPRAELAYECISAVRMYNCAFSSTVPDSTHLRYCDLCPGAKNAFGCVGYRGAEYAILNKRYTKEEYEALVPKIVTHMTEIPYIDGGGRLYGYGEFFPPELSPFPYNDSQAQDYFPKTQEEILEAHFSFREPEVRKYDVTLQAELLPESIADVSDSILKEVIECKSCSKAYRFIPSELSFYKQLGLPLPHYCSTCRHRSRTQKRNPLTLFHRNCQCKGNTSTEELYSNVNEHEHAKIPCKTEFETIYAHARPEIVYCEQCYLNETQ